MKRMIAVYRSEIPGRLRWSRGLYGFKGHTGVTLPGGKTNLCMIDFNYTINDVCVWFHYGGEYKLLYAFSDKPSPAEDIRILMDVFELKSPQCPCCGSRGSVEVTASGPGGLRCIESNPFENTCHINSSNDLYSLMPTWKWRG